MKNYHLKSLGNLKFIIVVVLGLIVSSLYAQELKVVDASSVNINDLPEYIVITSENTRLLGGIGITIDAKKSVYQDVLEELEHILQNQKKLRIRNQTDLLNALSQLGFEFIDSYNAGANSTSSAEYGYEYTKQRINMVFRKKEKYRIQ